MYLCSLEKVITFKNFIGMVTRESRHAYFCILQTHQFSKDLRVYCPKKRSSIAIYSVFFDYGRNSICNFKDS